MQQHSAHAQPGEYRSVCIIVQNNLELPGHIWGTSRQRHDYNIYYMNILTKLTSDDGNYILEVGGTIKVKQNK